MLSSRFFAIPASSESDHFRKDGTVRKKVIREVREDACLPRFCEVQHSPPTKRIVLFQYSTILKFNQGKSHSQKSSSSLVPTLPLRLLSALHFFEQHVTSSQHLSHFFLHAKGLPQTTHIFSGKLDLSGFFSIFPPFPLPRRPKSRTLDAIGIAGFVAMDDVVSFVGALLSMLPSRPGCLRCVGFSSTWG